MSQLTRNLTFHKLFSWDKRNCLYCNQECTFSVVGDWEANDVYSCPKCREDFECHYTYDEPCYAFRFTCKELVIHIFYETENVGISFKSNPGLPKFWINNLEDLVIDFSDKEALHAKLRTYLIFS